MNHQITKYFYKYLQSEKNDEEKKTSRRVIHITTLLVPSECVWAPRPHAQSHQPIWPHLLARRMRRFAIEHWLSSDGTFIFYFVFHCCATWQLTVNGESRLHSFQPRKCRVIKVNWFRCWNMWSFHKSFVRPTRSIVTVFCRCQNLTKSIPGLKPKGKKRKNLTICRHLNLLHFSVQRFLKAKNKQMCGLICRCFTYSIESHLCWRSLRLHEHWTHCGI